jgi:cold shock protein
MNGVIKRLTDRGFGFIGAAGQEKDIFFHSKSLVDVQFDDLREGDNVTFEVENGDKGPAAVNVRLAEAAEGTLSGEAANDNGAGQMAA